MTLDILNNHHQITIKDKAAYLLVFLFPIAGMSVRHWVSGIFTLLVLLSFSYLWRRTEPLVKEEKILLWILGLFFAVFIVTAVVNGWTERQTNYLGVEIRYLLAIPFYLMVRQLPHACAWILRGCVIGAVVLGAQAFYDIEILHWPRAVGRYSPNLMGPYAVLVAFWLLSALNMKKKQPISRYLIPVAILCALYAAIMSGSRGAYLGFVVLLLAWLVLEIGRRQRITVFVASIVFLVATYNLYPGMSERVNSATDEIEYVIDEHRDNQGSISGIEARVEMWRASLMLIQENPLLGIGRGNYEAILPELIANGRVNRALEPHGLGHPHNAYLEVLVSKGIPGFLVFITMLLYPLYLFSANHSLSVPWAASGTLHLIGFMVFSLTDASTFIKGNYTAIFLVFLLVFYSQVIRAKRHPAMDADYTLHHP